MTLGGWLGSALADLRFGLRQCLKAPAITVAVLLSLGIGIAVNIAVFTLLDAATLRALPVPNPGRLVAIEWSNADGYPRYVNSISGGAYNAPDGAMVSTSVSAPMYRRLAERSAGFAALLGISDASQVSVSVGSAQSEPYALQYVSANFFQGLEVIPPLGRGFVQQDDRAGPTPAVIVSHRFWNGRLGGNPAALGQVLRVNDVDVRIVGVAPPRFFGVSVGQWTDLYAPLAARALLDRARGSSTEDPTNWWVRQIGVLSERVPEAQALAELDSPFHTEITEIAGSADAIASMPSLVASPARRGIDAPGDEIQSALWLLMLLVGLLLLIVCANVANLLLARSESRLRESTIRLTLGATPARIFRQQLIESLSYALVGGALGVALGFALSELIHDVFQTGRDVSDSFALELDGRVAGFGIALSIGTALLFGMAPAFRAARSNLRGNLVQHSRTVAATGLRAASVLVSAELALCLTALVAAGLLSRSLQGLTRIDLGFDPENLVYATVNPDLSALPDERIEGYLNAVQSSLEALPGVESVSRMARRPLEGGGNFSPVTIPGDPRAEAFDPRVTVIVNNVGSEVFETLGIPLRSGQTVDPARNGVVVDERFAERFFGNLDVLGRRFGTGAATNGDQYEIIGIARNAFSYRLRTEPLPTVYVPYDRADAGGPIHFAIRTAGEPTSMLGSIRTTAASVDPAVPVTELRTQQELLERMLRSERLLAFLSAGFGGLATLLAAIGMSGLLAYAVACRRGEIGLRMALGAAPARMTQMVMLDALKLIATGLAIGIPCVFVIAKLLASSLYELAPADPVTLTGSILVLLAISLGAAFVPARRAAKLAPITAMREE